MSSFNPRRFVNADTLSHVSAANLLQLLTATAGIYMAQPAPDGRPRVDLAASPLDFDRLVKVLIQADDADYPDALADALYHIATFSEEDAVTELLDAFQGRIVLAALGANQSPADVSLCAWLMDPVLVERVLGERRLYRSKNMVSYIGPADPGTPLGTIPAATLAGLQAALAAWFLKNRGSDFVRVLPYEMGDDTWFLVHHAKGAEHRSVIKNGAQTNLMDRPNYHILCIYPNSIQPKSTGRSNETNTICVPTPALMRHALASP